MKSYRMIAAPLLLCGLAACNGTPTNGLIPGSVYQLEQLNMVKPTGSAFTQALTSNYRTFAQAEKDEYDWNAQQVFAKKGLAAAAGNAPPPERLEDWSFHHRDHAAVDDLAAARTRLMSMLASDAPVRVPQWSSTAQTNFDCWLHEQHEGWEIARIAECRGAFMTAMDLIYAPPKMAAAPAEKIAPAANPAIYMVFFDFDKSDLSPEARRIIASAARAITAGHESKIKISGYTDTSGTVAYNLKLSLRRADAVEQELVRDGVSADGIGVDGKGEGDLLVKTPDGVREPQNRRATVELMLQ